jgi:hypothetical protein
VYHHAEFFRALNEFRIFCGEDVALYPSVRDNPFIMLRLGKVLAHLAQWAESQLTVLQKGAVGAKVLHHKMAGDPHLGYLVAVAGKDATGSDRFPGDSPNGPAVDTALRALLADIRSQTSADDRAWRALRVLYIVRNATAHQIETTLDFYKERQYLLDLLQVVLAGVFLIQQKKGVAVA